jgi:hypothetical protein
MIAWSQEQQDESVHAAFGKLNEDTKLLAFCNIFEWVFFALLFFSIEKALPVCTLFLLTVTVNYILEF